MAYWSAITMEAKSIPSVLYKYLRPDRIDVLKNCRIRFSQRAVFSDDRELQPDYASFGTAGEIWRFIISQGLKLDPRIPGNILIQFLASSPNHQKQMVNVAVANMKSTREMGILCLTEVNDCDAMWNEYASGGGFVIGFDTGHCGFADLRSTGIFGKVDYADEAIGSLLGMADTNVLAPLFRKRMAYAHEREWRAIKLLKNLECEQAGIFLARFDPGCICRIVVRPDCTIRNAIEEVLAQNIGYAHIRISTQE